MGLLLLCFLWHINNPQRFLLRQLTIQAGISGLGGSLQPLIVFKQRQIFFGQGFFLQRPFIAFIHPPLGPVKGFNDGMIHGGDLMLQLWRDLLAGTVILEDAVAVQRPLFCFRDKIPATAPTHLQPWLRHDEMDQQKSEIVRLRSENILCGQFLAQRYHLRNIVLFQVRKLLACVKFLTVQHGEEHIIQLKMEPHRIDDSLQHPCFGIICGSKVSPTGAKHTVKKQRCQQRAGQRILLCQCVNQIFRHIAEQLIALISSCV